MSYAIFLDLSGTLIKERGDGLPIGDPKDIELCGGVVPALQWMQDQYYKLISISNMSSIARGERTMKQILGVCERLVEILMQEGIKLTQIYLCPHDRNGGCRCRKPGTLMLEIARDYYNIDLSQSYMIGNTLSDVEAGSKAGCKESFLIGNGTLANILETTKRIRQLRY